MTSLQLRALSSLGLIVSGILVCFGPFWISFILCGLLFAGSLYEILTITQNPWIHLYTFFIFIACVITFKYALTNAPFLFHIFLVTWGHDIGGYFFGKFFKGPKVAPSVSPNKTWSGLFGGIALGLTVWISFKVFGYSMPLYMIFIANIFGLAGDLFESKIKRMYGLKDSSNLIPGHGGFLDRFDSFFAIVWVYYLFT